MPTTRPPTPAVGILTRAPAPGRAKTRLARTIGNAAAAELAAAMLHDTLAAVAPGPWRTALFVEPAGAVAELQVLTGHDDALPQAPGDLGARMQGAAATLLAAGHAPAILVGTDIPQLGVADSGAALVGEAIATLRDADLVFGPAADGGYYLIGLNALRPGREPALFRPTIAWSSEHVLAQSQAIAAQVALRSRRLRTLSDIDTAADLASLRARLLAADDPGRVAGPRTRALVTTIDLPADAGDS